MYTERRQQQQQQQQAGSETWRNGEMCWCTINDEGSDGDAGRRQEASCCKIDAHLPTVCPPTSRYAWSCAVSTTGHGFYRAMLCIRGTSHWPVSVCVCPSVTSRCSIETAERIEPVFGMWASFHPSYIVLKGNSVISKKKGTSLWNFVLNFGLRKFRHGLSIVETCYRLSSRKVDAHNVINWAVVGHRSR